MKNNVRRDKALNKNDQLRLNKDVLKETLKQLYAPNLSFTGIIMPKINHTPSKVDRAMPWYFNGFLLSFGDGLLVVDPGVDFYSRFTTTGYTVKDVRAIFVSHQHLDHCGDLLVFIDIVAKTKTPVDLFLPINVVDDVLPEYYRELVYNSDNINLIILNENQITTFEPRWRALSSLKPIRLYHTTAHTFGFTVKFDNKAISYISDTGYATKVRSSGKETPPDLTKGFEKIVEKHDDLRLAICNTTTLICNINDLFYNRHSLTHLTGWDVADMLKGSAVKKLIFQHLSTYDANGINSNTIYKDFFADDPYEVIVPIDAEQREPFA